MGNSQQLPKSYGIRGFRGSRDPRVRSRVWFPYGFLMHSSVFFKKPYILKRFHGGNLDEEKMAGDITLTASCVRRCKVMLRCFRILSEIDIWRLLFKDIFRKDMVIRWILGDSSMLLEKFQSNPNSSRWWFQSFFIFTPTWGNDPIWLIFFKWVENTT